MMTGALFFSAIAVGCVLFSVGVLAAADGEEVQDNAQGRMMQG